ncbi:ThiF family adenylyltransferase [Vibrio natriegens]|uniref:shikimate dehydrogenase family protein n=1 Tax=Vibrio natriegens TaxID=691 RepID=UPI001EFE2D7A|nr:ThiF family adenylyltransferase [Vibrio natriegens]MCG9699124.1 ThiF family adenylyltransferase [Vibrio natriegens]
MQCRLFGKNITRSKSPYFHNELAKHLNINFSYQLNSIDSGDIEEFKSQATALFASEIQSANVTYPFKEIAIEIANKLDKSAQRVQAANTLVKKGEDIIAYNTDYSGFIQAYRNSREQTPGRVVLVGCGGVGKAVAMSLVDLGASELILFDMDENKAQALANQLSDEDLQVTTANSESLESYVKLANGLVNCTPVGHYSMPGTPIPESWIGSQEWVFDAVYTPVDTQFLLAAKEKNVSIISGFELFFHQATDAFSLFTNTKPNPAELAEFRESHFTQLC